MSTDTRPQERSSDENISIEESSLLILGAIGIFVIIITFSYKTVDALSASVSVSETGGADLQSDNPKIENKIPDDIYPGKWVSPLSGIEIPRDITQGAHGVNNNAVDLRAEIGTNIHAPKAGRVIERGYVWNVHGNYLRILHRGGIITGYCHLSEFYVNEGDIIQQGQVIGLTGDTGRVTGPHLHFSVSGARNPFIWD